MINCKHAEVQSWRPCYEYNRRREKIDPRNAKFVAKNKKTLAKNAAELRKKFGGGANKKCRGGFVWNDDTVRRRFRH